MMKMSDTRKKFGIAEDISTAHGKILIHASMTISKNSFAKEIPLFMRAQAGQASRCKVARDKSATLLSFFFGLYSF
jgi:hypothetical protein